MQTGISEVLGLRVVGYLTRARQGYFYNTTDRGGAIFCPPPPQNSGTTGRIYKIQAALDISGKFLGETYFC